MILAIRTDQDEAYVAFVQDGKEVAAKRWVAGRQLSQELLSVLKGLVQETGLDSYGDLERIVVYEGPGSYTGLRIGMSVANALSYTYNKPIFTSSGDDWVRAEGSKETIGLAVPEYGGNTRVSQPKK